jgi:hypothetical protein
MNKMPGDDMNGHRPNEIVNRPELEAAYKLKIADPHKKPKFEQDNKIKQRIAIVKAIIASELIELYPNIQLDPMVNIVVDETPEGRKENVTFKADGQTIVRLSNGDYSLEQKRE